MHDGHWWKLCQLCGRQLLSDPGAWGSLTRTSSDMPWFEGTFEAADGFEAIRSLFDRERELFNADLMDAWDALWCELAQGLRLEPLDGGEPLTEFLLHIGADGLSATWRY